MKSTFLLYIFGLLIVGAWSAPVSGSYCYSNDATPYRLYSTHSDYDDVRGRDTDFTVSGCEPRLVYLLARHGIRYPTTSDYIAMKHRLPELQTQIVGSLSNGTLCPEDQLILTNWTLRMTAEDAENLAESGNREAYELGRRFLDRFPDLFDVFSPDKFAFQHTWKPRTGDTARRIAQGLFNITEHIDMDVNPKGHDPVLRFFDTCPLFEKTIHDKPVEEERRFYAGHEMGEVLRRVTSRLGLHTGVLSRTDLDMLYNACAFEYTIFNQSPWCVLFEPEDLKVLQYLHDIKYYWEYGYGHELNYLQTCDLTRDVLGHLSGAASNGSLLNGVIRVGHDNTLLGFYARFGLFNDTLPLLANNFAEQANRRWKPAYFSSFGANIAFVLYTCGGQSKVRTFVDEKPIILPMCAGQEVCPLSTILNSEVGMFEKSCNFDKICTYPACGGHKPCEVEIVG